MTDSPAPITYQLKVFLLGISPMIWRRFLVNGNSTITDSHYTLQLMMGWSDYHLNRFIIHGKQYGVCHSGGLSFSDDPNTVRLVDLRLRERGKFRGFGLATPKTETTPILSSESTRRQTRHISLCGLMKLKSNDVSSFNFRGAV